MELCCSGDNVLGWILPGCLLISESKNRLCSTDTLMSTFARINNTRPGVGRHIGKLQLCPFKDPSQIGPYFIVLSQV